MVSVMPWIVCQAPRKTASILLPSANTPEEWEKLCEILDIDATAHDEEEFDEHALPIC
jgi:hypothetical protein